MDYQVSEIELAYKSRLPMHLRPKIEKSEDAYQVLINHWDNNKIEFIEQFKILILNTANRVLGIVEISTGTTKQTLIDIKLIFVSAIKANATSIILSHNHPSGNLKPSREDMLITKKLVQAGQLLDIKIHDHLIVAPSGYYSFADSGEMYYP